ncbi:hypothetical protein R3P38DRAFT_3258122 [Favolaschia claudopus]|uniref:Uncharacterized protein n=1 Tax=Favolaschia claudopus TaxID=2862362 RepID=A0AAW0D6Q4_9AGAR
MPAPYHLEPSPRRFNPAQLSERRAKLSLTEGEIPGARLAVKIEEMLNFRYQTVRLISVSDNHYPLPAIPATSDRIRSRLFHHLLLRSTTTLNVPQAPVDTDNILSIVWTLLLYDVAILRDFDLLAPWPSEVSAVSTLPPPPLCRRARVLLGRPRAIGTANELYLWASIPIHVSSSLRVLITTNAYGSGVSLGLQRYEGCFECAEVHFVVSYDVSSPLPTKKPPSSLFRLPHAADTLAPARKLLNHSKSTSTHVSSDAPALPCTHPTTNAQAAPSCGGWCLGALMKAFRTELRGLCRVATTIYAKSKRSTSLAHPIAFYESSTSAMASYMGRVSTPSFPSTPSVLNAHAQHEYLLVPSQHQSTSPPSLAPLLPSPALLPIPPSRYRRSTYRRRFDSPPTSSSVAFPLSPKSLPNANGRYPRLMRVGHVGVLIQDNHTYSGPTNTYASLPPPIRNIRASGGMMRIGRSARGASKPVERRRRLEGGRRVERNGRGDKQTMGTGEGGKEGYVSGGSESRPPCFSALHIPLKNGSFLVRTSVTPNYHRHFMGRRRKHHTEEDLRLAARQYDATYAASARGRLVRAASSLRNTRRISKHSIPRLPPLSYKIERIARQPLPEQDPAFQEAFRSVHHSYEDQLVCWKTPPPFPEENNGQPLDTESADWEDRACQYVADTDALLAAYHGMRAREERQRDRQRRREWAQFGKTASLEQAREEVVGLLQEWDRLHALPRPKDFRVYEMLSTHVHWLARTIHNLYYVKFLHKVTAADFVLTPSTNDGGELSGQKIATTAAKQLEAKKDG